MHEPNTMKVYAHTAITIVRDIEHNLVQDFGNKNAKRLCAEGWRALQAAIIALRRVESDANDLVADLLTSWAFVSSDKGGWPHVLICCERAVNTWGEPEKFDRKKEAQDALVDNEHEPN